MQSPAVRVRPCASARPLSRIAAGLGRRPRLAATPPSSSSSPSSSSGAPPTLRQPPIPPSLPVLQHMPFLLASVAQHGSIEPLLYDWATKTAGADDSGGIVQWLVPGAPPVALVAGPDAVRSIFDVGRWPKSPLYKDLEPLLGEQSLVLTEGKEWRGQRDAYNSGFSGAFLRTAFDGFCAATEELVRALDRDAESGTVVRMWEYSVLATVEIIVRVGFGEARGLLSRADRDPLADPLYRAFYDLGTHVSWFLDNVPLNRLKNLPWNVAKTARLRQELERQLGLVLDARIAAMRRSGVLPAGVRVVSGGGGGGGGSNKGSEEAASASACPFAGLAGAAGKEGGPPRSATAVEGEGASAIAAVAAAGNGDNGSRSSTLREDDQMSLGAPAAAAAVPRNVDDIISTAVATLVAQGAKEIDRSGLFSQMATLYGAGHDTTAGSISWAIYFLSRDDKRRARLVAELDAVFAERRRRKGPREGESGKEDEDEDDGDGDGDAIELPTWEELSSLPYLTAVFKETLRFRPAVGIIARACPVPAPQAGAESDDAAALAPRSSDDPARGAVRGVDMRGKIAVVSPYVLHRLERYWGKDAGEWVPERWLDNEGEPVAEGAAPKPARALSVPVYAYLPFSRGERDCIGSRFATIEAKLILAALFRRFDFEWAGSAQGERVRMALTAHPAERVPMRVTRRRRGKQAGAGAQRVAAAQEVVGVAAR